MVQACLTWEWSGMDLYSTHPITVAPFVTATNMPSSTMYWWHCDQNSFWFSILLASFPLFLLCSRCFTLLDDYDILGFGLS